LTSKTLADTQQALADLIKNNPTFQNNSGIAHIYDSITNLTTNYSTLRLEEPLRVMGDFVGSGNDWSRLQSILRERDAEVSLLKSRIIDIEKSHIRTEYSGVDNQRTLTTLRAENALLVKELDKLKSLASLATNSGHR